MEPTLPRPKSSIGYLRMSRSARSKTILRKSRCRSHGVSRLRRQNRPARHLSIIRTTDIAMLLFCTHSQCLYKDGQMHRPAIADTRCKGQRRIPRAKYTKTVVVVGLLRLNSSNGVSCQLLHSTSCHDALTLTLRVSAIWEATSRYCLSTVMSKLRVVLKLRTAICRCRNMQKQCESCKV